jgi:hypothetical protein
MGKILIINGANFSSVAVAQVTPITDPIDLDDYVESTYTTYSKNYVNALVDKDGRILCAETTNGSIVDNSSIVGNATVTDGTPVVGLINAYKLEIQ